MTTHIMAAMSGGVDSSVTAALLLESGYQVSGATMRLYDSPDSSRPCGTETNIRDARRICELLDIPFSVFDFTALFRREVIDRFADGYIRGLTPNPCVDCNRHLKFGKFLEQARALGCDKIATGHYAQIEYSEHYARWVLKKGALPEKDQSYVLYSMTQDELSHTLFPLGGMDKESVRRLAEERGLINARKSDSQDICFIPDGNHTRFLCEECGAPCAPGKFLNPKGEVIGTHKGILGYTVGQRRGLGISADRRLYVIDKDAETNTVTVGYEEDLMCSSFIVSDCNWIALSDLTEPLRAAVRTRYHGSEPSCTLTPLADGTVRVRTDIPQRAVSPGQAAVFYDGDIVLGGGTITKTDK